MGFTRFTKNVLNVSALPDRVQNQASALKLVFDQSGVDIKAALNGLIAELEDSASAGSIGASVESVTTNTIQAILTAFDEYIADRYTKNETDTLISANTNTLISDVDINLTTGVITITKKDGTVETFDTAIEKVPAKFEIIESGSSFFLRITNVDGTYTQTDITKLMNIYKFNNSEDIAFEVNGTGNEKMVTASIRANSIGLDKLSLSAVSTIEGYVASAKDSASAAKISETNAKSSEIIAQNAATSAEQNAQIASEAVSASNIATEKAIEARSYARGGTGTRAGEDKDNAKYYCERAKEVAGGDIILNSEFEEAMANVPNYTELALTGEIIETDTSLALESVLSINGNSEQDNRSGKNLFDLTSVTGSYCEVTPTITNGVIHVKGTNNADYPNKNSYRNGYVSALITNDLEFGVDYYISCKIEVIENPKNFDLSYFGCFIDSDKGLTLSLNSTTGRYECKRNIPEGATLRKGIEIRIDSCELNISEVMITKTPNEEYEPYGAMPSPDYPSEIRSVKSKSDNLFDISTKTDNMSFIWANGENTAATGTIRSDYIPIGDIKTLSSNYKFHITFHNSNKDYLGNGPGLTTSGQESVYSMAIPSNSNIAYFRVTYKPKASASENPADMTTVTDIMLNKGNKALPYQPYGYVPVEARVEGKNLFNINGDVNSRYNGTTASYNTVAGNELTTTVNLGSLNGYGQRIYVGAGNTITVSAKFFAMGAEYTENDTVARIIFHNDGVKTQQIINFFPKDLGRTKSSQFIAETDYVYVVFGAYTSRIPSAIFTDIQVELGFEATSYTPYIEPKILSLPLGDIELRSTPDGTRDTFVRVDGVWNKVENVKSIILDGSDDEGWELYGSHCFRMRYNNKGPNSTGVNEGTILCNRYTSQTQKDVQANGGIVDYGIAARVEGTNGFVIKNKDVTNLVDWMALLAINPLEIVYVPQTPTYTPITSNALITALDELESLVLHKGYNRITATSVNGVKAYLDLNIPATAFITNVETTESSLDMPVLIASGEGNVKTKISENGITLNPATGVVKVKDIQVDGKKAATEEYVNNIISSAITTVLEASY